MEPLIKRLEKLDQIKQEYHLQKAAGFFLAQVQRRRFIRDLWKKRDEDEVKKLGITSNAYQLSAPSPGSNGWKYVPKHRKKPMIDGNVIFLTCIVLASNIFIL